MRFNDNFKHPRLFVEQDLKLGTEIMLTPNQAHYLRNVMRKKDENAVRLFNGRDGEWLATLALKGKKEAYANPFEHFKTQPQNTNQTHLLFAPIKKKQMEFMIEKAVELGVTDFHPVITARTENRKLNLEKSTAHIQEAAEQCERLELPTLHKPEKLIPKIQNWNTESPIHWCAERMENTKHLSDCNDAHAYLIGPEGGFDSEETQFLKGLEQVIPIDLGEQILRAETAALYCLSHSKLLKK